MWAVWVAGALLVWLLVAVAVGIVIGRGIRLADRRETWPANVVVDPAPVGASARPAARRRRVPLPPVGVALAALAVVLESCGYVVRLTQPLGPVRHLLSMDAPLSLPRMYVAALFAAAAAAAVIAGGNLPERRTWWMAVGAVAGLIAAVKAGGTIHAAALGALSRTFGTVATQAISVVLAVAVLGALWFLSRHDRRDRRRILGTLALYAVAAVGLSAVSEFIGQLTGGGFAAAAAATYVEESGEALSAVAFLIAVLIGVAPRVVLPADWALRREADAYTADATQLIAGRPLPR